MNNDEIIKRLKATIGQKASAQDIAKAVGASTTNVYNWTKKESAKIPLHFLMDYCKKTHISIDWLLFGRGNKYATLINLDPIETEDEISYTLIPYYEEFSLSAGSGVINEDHSPVDIISVPKQLFSTNKNIEAVKVIGDSMDPTILDGSIVFVERNIQSIKNNTIHAIIIDGEVLVKRLYTLPGEKILIKSDNEDYPELTVNKKEITLIGHIKGVMQRL